MRLRFLLALALPFTLMPLLEAAPQDGSRASYRVTIDLTWSAATHPGLYPGNAHVSPPIGATHVPGFHLWQPGGIATGGIESMAETGSTGPLSNEIHAAIASGDAGARLLGNTFGAPALRTMDLEVTKQFSAVSLVTMVAPSPDWFVGCDDVQLLENGVWVETVTIPLLVWDAGTDSGANFTSFNQNTSPQEPIALQDGGPFRDGGPALGTMTFSRRSSLLVYGSFNPAGTMTVAGEPTLGSTLSLTLDDPFSVMGVGSQTILVVSAVRSPIFPARRSLPGFGLASPTADGELLVGMPFQRRFGPAYMGGPVTHSFDLPSDPSLAGTPLFLQGVFIEPGVKFGLTDAVEVVLGN
ncbi:Spondin_N [Planctomycetes bacterium Poly30]|uniref:Spondin_N n=1 Tax=Saltatorellus ferox TaxID=2528018 RepID=A0A518EM44_9BACT|nr:Spondin_N [Planctomycetes bacterium Poly30]